MPPSLFSPPLRQLLFGLSAVELDLFDGFEDDEYERVEVTVAPEPEPSSADADGDGAEVRCRGAQ